MYDSFFGLTGLPFRLIPDPCFLFIAKGHREAFAALQEGLAAGARILVLTGEVGAGKTTLLQALLKSVDQASTITAHISVSGLDAEMLSNRVLEALGYPSPPHSVAPRDALLARLRSGPLATLLVIDEAQHLDFSAFELLEAMANASATAPARLQICLVGQPELRCLINAEESGGFRELIDVDRHLRPLEQAEIRLYVEHRLHRAGWTGRPEFEDAAFVEIFIFTAGIPRRVNLLCNSLLLSAWLKRQERIDAPAVTRAAAALRGESFKGASDLSHVEHPPTLTEALEPAAPTEDGRARGHDSDPWSCPSCDTVNPPGVIECWQCKAARPSPPGVAELPSEADLRPHAGVVPASEPAAPGAVHSDVAMSARGLDDPAPPTMSDGTPQDDSVAPSETINDRLAGLMQQPESPARRRRKTILASVASVAVALAVIAYMLDRHGSRASLSQGTLRDVVGKQVPVPPPATALDRIPSSATSLPAASSPPVPSASSPSPQLASPAPVPDTAKGKASQDSYATQDAAAGQMPGITAAAPETRGPAGSVPAASPMPPSCSGPASALGLCDAERSSSKRED